MYLVKVSNNEDFEVGRAGHTFDGNVKDVEVAIDQYHYADLALCPYLSVELLEEDYIKPPESTEGLDVELLVPDNSSEQEDGDSGVAGGSADDGSDNSEGTQDSEGSGSHSRPAAANEQTSDNPNARGNEEAVSGGAAQQSESHEQAEGTGDGSGGSNSKE